MRRNIKFPFSKLESKTAFITVTESKKCRNTSKLKGIILD